MENKDLPKLVNSQLTYLLSKEKDKDTTIPENPSPYAEDPFKDAHLYEVREEDLPF